MTYSFCESVHASGRTKWHIRQLTDAGRKLNGGIDTESLCGRVKPPYGWDLSVPIDAQTMSVACPACVELLGEHGKSRKATAR